MHMPTGAAELCTGGRLDPGGALSRPVSVVACACVSACVCRRGGGCTPPTAHTLQLAQLRAQAGTGLVSSLLCLQLPALLGLPLPLWPCPGFTHGSFAHAHTTCTHKQACVHTRRPRERRLLPHGFSPEAPSSAGLQARQGRHGTSLAPRGPVPAPGALGRLHAGSCPRSQAYGTSRDRAHVGPACRAAPSPAGPCAGAISPALHISPDVMQFPCTQQPEQQCRPLAHPCQRAGSAQEILHPPLQSVPLKRQVPHAAFPAWTPLPTGRLRSGSEITWQGQGQGGVCPAKPGATPAGSGGRLRRRGRDCRAGGKRDSFLGLQPAGSRPPGSAQGGMSTCPSCPPASTYIGGLGLGNTLWGHDLVLRHGAPSRSPRCPASRRCRECVYKHPQAIQTRCARLC